MIPTKFPVARDIIDRVWRTFLAALTAAALSDGFNLQHVLQIDTVKTYLFAGLAAATSLVLSLIATQVGKWRGHATSASFDPAVKLQPVGTEPDDQ